MQYFSYQTSALLLNSQSRAASTSTGSDIAAKKPVNNPAKVAEEDEVIADMRILRTLSSYLWPKENPEFRRRVLVALGLLIGSKVRRDQR